MKRITSEWLKDPKAQAVCTVLNSAGYQAYFVGGCVRNDLLGAAISDIDLATDARPQMVMELAEKAGLHAVPTGVEHGTVTIVSDGLVCEVTTFRKDIETDGRRAVVHFSEAIEDDAKRRDFTMNALYANAAGEVLDPLNGLPDLIKRRVRFIENADERIREDYLRILRFFRFHAWYGDPDAGLDAEGLAAVAANQAGLETLSRERIGHEMLKLLAAPDPAPAMARAGTPPPPVASHTAARSPGSSSSERAAEACARSRLPRPPGAPTWCGVRATDARPLPAPDKGP